MTEITARAGELCAYLEKEHSALCARIDGTSDLTREDRAELLSYAKEFLEAK